MSVGNQPTQASVNNLLSSLAVQMRNICDQIRVQYTYVSTLGVTGLEALGYSPADAASVLQLMGYLNSIAAVYYGTGTQQSPSNFDQALSVAWGGQ